MRGQWARLPAQIDVKCSFAKKKRVGLESNVRRYGLKQRPSKVQVYGVSWQKSTIGGARVVFECVGSKVCADRRKV